MKFLFGNIWFALIRVRILNPLTEQAGNLSLNMTDLGILGMPSKEDLKPHLGYCSDA
jgi:hypothetical protein